MSLHRVISLAVKLLLNELKEVVLRDVLELLRAAGASLPNEPLEDLFKCILPTLLVCDVIAVSGLLIKLSKRVCSLFEAYLEAIQVNVSTIGDTCLLHGLLTLDRSSHARLYLVE